MNTKIKGNKYSLETCLKFPEILPTPGCADNLTPSMCASTPSITMLPLCLGFSQHRIRNYIVHTLPLKNMTI